VYILIAIALLAALTMSFMEPSSQQTTSQNTFKATTSLRGQVEFIQAAIQECVLLYPKGDSNIDTSGSGSDPNARDNYPIDPDSTYYATATPGRSGDQLVKNIRCPGNNPGGASVDDHEKIFGGSTGKHMPPIPDFFDDWQYYNGEDGVFFWTKTNKTDSFITTALTKLDEDFSECEADVVDASSSAENLDSNGTYECASGYTCFRVRMITNDTAEWNGDSGDESGC
jgi:type II secretory pathway pseudopilin PulG